MLHADLAPAVQECLDFLASSEELPPKCDAIFLGPDIGLVNVFTWSDEEGDCKLSMQELATVCAQFFQECLDFLASSEDLEPVCEQIWLGPDIGFANVFEYHDEDDSCKLSLAELGQVCTGQFFQACLDFLASSEGIPKCDAIFLGPDIGLVNVMEYHDEDDSCKISMTELGAVCANFFAECLAFLESSEEVPPPF